MAGLIREQQVARGNANSNMYEAVINSWRRLRRTREPAPLFASVMLLPASFHEGGRFFFHLRLRGRRASGPLLHGCVCQSAHDAARLI